MMSAPGASRRAARAPFPARRDTRLAYGHSSCDFSLEFSERLVAVRPHDHGLAGGSEQCAVFGPQMHKSVAETVGDRVHAYVGEHPFGRDAMRDAQRVVEAVATGALTERLADTERYEVADDRERG